MIQNNEEDVPNLEDWMKLMPTVNKCGDDFLTVFSKYKNKLLTDIKATTGCFLALEKIQKKFGELPHACCVSIFYHNGCSTKLDSFSACIREYYTFMPADLGVKVERYRYQNTKLKESMKQISNTI